MDVSPHFKSTPRTGVLATIAKLRRIDTYRRLGLSDNVIDVCEDVVALAAGGPTGETADAFTARLTAFLSMPPAERPKGVLTEVDVGPAADAEHTSESTETAVAVAKWEALLSEVVQQWDACAALSCPADALRPNRDVVKGLLHKVDEHVHCVTRGTPQQRAVNAVHRLHETAGLIRSMVQILENLA